MTFWCRVVGLILSVPKELGENWFWCEFFYCKGRCGTYFYDLLRPDKTSLLWEYSSFYGGPSRWSSTSVILTFQRTTISWSLWRRTLKALVCTIYHICSEIYSLPVYRNPKLLQYWPLSYSCEWYFRVCTAFAGCDVTQDLQNDFCCSPHSCCSVIQEDQEPCEESWSCGSCFTEFISAGKHFVLKEELLTCFLKSNLLRDLGSAK